MRTGKDRVRVEAMQEPVNIGGIRVMPGDWLRGNSDGLVAIPASRIDEVLAVAQEVHKGEDAIRAEIDKGTPLRKARAEFNCHSLRTRRDRQ